MAKKTSNKSKSKAKVVRHRHFRPSYDAHPLLHLLSAVAVLVLLGVIMYTAMLAFNGY